MTPQTTYKLIKLNQDFYERIGPIWNPAADYVWQGWEMVSEQLSEQLIVNSEQSCHPELVSGAKKLEDSVTTRPFTVIPDLIGDPMTLGVKNSVEATTTTPVLDNNFHTKPNVSRNSGLLRVLDLGCGNGRFANFLATSHPNLQIEYTGIDNSDFLLNQAKENLALTPKTPVEGITDRQDYFATSKSLQPSNSTLGDYKSNLTVNLLKNDLILGNWDANFTSYKFHLIVLFGLLHHVPGQQQRLTLLQKATELLNPSGLLIFTTWRFAQIPRLQKRMVDLKSERGQNILRQLELDPAELEPGDHILDWVKKELAYRYSHDYSSQEIQEILSSAKLTLKNRFYADGRTEDQNEYFLCRKTS